MKYGWIKEQCDSFSVTAMCRTLDDSTSGYYWWLKAESGLRVHWAARIRTSIKQVYDAGLLPNVLFESRWFRWRFLWWIVF